MSVSYKRLQHMLVERDISYSQLMRLSNIPQIQYQKSSIFNISLWINLKVYAQLWTAPQITSLFSHLIMKAQKPKMLPHINIKNELWRINCLAQILIDINYLTKII